MLCTSTDYLLCLRIHFVNTNLVFPTWAGQSAMVRICFQSRLAMVGPDLYLVTEYMMFTLCENLVLNLLLH